MQAPALPSRRHTDRDRAAPAPVPGPALGSRRSVRMIPHKLVVDGRRVRYALSDNDGRLRPRRARAASPSGPSTSTGTSPAVACTGERAATWPRPSAGGCSTPACRDSRAATPCPGNGSPSRRSPTWSATCSTRSERSGPSSSGTPWAGPWPCSSPTPIPSGSSASSTATAPPPRDGSTDAACSCRCSLRSFPTWRAWPTSSWPPSSTHRTCSSDGAWPRRCGDCGPTPGATSAPWGARCRWARCSWPWTCGPRSSASWPAASPSSRCGDASTGS